MDIRTKAGLENVDPATVKAAGYDDFAKMLNNSLYGGPLSTSVMSKLILERERIKAGY